MSGGTGTPGFGSLFSGSGATPYNPQVGTPNTYPGPTQGGNGGLMGAMGGKGGQGGQQLRRGWDQQIPSPQQPQYAPLAPQGQFNVNQASAGALQQAMRGTQAGMGFQPERARAA